MAQSAYGGNYSNNMEMPTASFQMLGGTSKAGPVISNDNDRGDEINLDELQRYIGGGSRF